MFNKKVTLSLKKPTPVAPTTVAPTPAPALPVVLLDANKTAELLTKAQEEKAKRLLIKKYLSAEATAASRPLKCVRDYRTSEDTTHLYEVGTLTFHCPVGGSTVTVMCYGCGTLILRRVVPDQHKLSLEEFFRFRDQTLQEAYEIHKVAGKPVGVPSKYYRPLSSYMGPSRVTSNDTVL